MITKEKPKAKIKTKILIVDDQFGIRMLLSEVLKKEGYETYQAANGFQALEVVKETRPDLVILDMKMPGMDGLETLEKIHEIDPTIKAMIITAFGDLKTIENAKESGLICGHFAKPFNIDVVKAAVEHYCLDDRQLNE